MARKKLKTSIYSLAKELGLSPATVSKALNNAENVAQDTRSRVVAKAEEYGFKRQGFQNSFTNICALIELPNDAPTAFSSYVCNVLDGIRKYTTANKMEMSYFVQSAEFFNDISLAKLLSRRRVNGVILINGSNKSDYVKQLVNAKVPYCALQSQPGKIKSNILRLDGKTPLDEATQHLIQLGHTKIAYLNELVDKGVGDQRFEGFKNAMNNAGLDIDPSLMFSSSNTPDINGSFQFGYTGINAFIYEKKEFTAVITSSNPAAIGAMRALSEHGIEIPKQCSIIACDDSPSAPYLNPPLSCIDFSNMELGYAGAKWVHQMLKGDAPETYPYEFWMKSEVILRKSTGSCPN